MCDGLQQVKLFSIKHFTLSTKNNKIRNWLCSVHNSLENILFKNGYQLENPNVFCR